MAVQNKNRGRGGRREASHSIQELAHGYIDDRGTVELVLGSSIELRRRDLVGRPSDHSDPLMGRLGAEHEGEVSRDGKVRYANDAMNDGTCACGGRRRRRALDQRL